mgnify:FL=1
MNIERNEFMIKITADENTYITNYEKTFFTKQLCLPVTANVEEFEEVGRDVWKYFVKEENPDMVELQAQTQDINRTMDVIMTALVNSDEQNSSAIDAMLLAIDDLYMMLESVLNKDGE